MITKKGERQFRFYKETYYEYKNWELTHFQDDLSPYEEWSAEYKGLSLFPPTMEIVNLDDPENCYPQICPGTDGAIYKQEELPSLINALEEANELIPEWMELISSLKKERMKKVHK